MWTVKFGNQAGAQNTYNRRPDKAVSSADRPQTLSIAVVYDLPVGKGKAFGSRMPKVANAIFGDWRISAIQRYQSGAPLGIASNQNLFGAGNPRASFAAGAGVTIPLINPAWNSSDAVAASVSELNKAAFVFPANMTYGNTPLRIAQLRGPKTINEDIAVLKNFHIAEKRYFEFRLSAFNALNRHIFPGPDTNMASSTFGFITSPQGNTPRNVQLGMKFYF